jgi:hypothetical protein|tara:strand:+ start:381 stop:629 length:249 start_codon:yes stop_codon:yes gene_type:complete
MMTQAKDLRAALKTAGIKDREGKLPSVRTERIHVGNGDYEYGKAVAHAVSLEQKEIEELKNISQYIKIYNNVELGFSIIDSH